MVDDENFITKSDIKLSKSNSMIIPKPPRRKESLKTVDFTMNLEEGRLKLLSQSCHSYEGESIENLDIDYSTFESSSNDKELIINDEFNNNNNNIILNSPKIDNIIPFPKQPCFSEFTDLYSLKFFGQIIQIIKKITTHRKSRFGILLTDRLILFKKPEHKVSKLQIPINRIERIYWHSQAIDGNKFKIDTALKSYKFQCLNNTTADLWINHIDRLLINRCNSEPPKYILKAIVTIENVKRKRVFIIESQYTVAYYETEEEFCNDIAMHRVQLRSSGVRRDSANSACLEIITSYRKYRLYFDSSDTCSQWFSTLSEMIEKAISATFVSTASAAAASSSSPLSSNQIIKSGEVVMAEIYSNDSNRRCADCSKEGPEWASVNLFITLCSHCSGLHRSLGRHISSVQGILTDEFTWQDSSVVKLFSVIGNKNANDFFLANHNNRSNLPIGEVNRRFIYEKYVRKAFIGQQKELINDQKMLNVEMFRAVTTSDVMKTMMLYHLGADINYIDEGELGWGVFRAAREAGQMLQLAFLNNQSKHVIRDWRHDLFYNYNIDDNYENNGDINNNNNNNLINNNNNNNNNESQSCCDNFKERCLICSINRKGKELRKLFILKHCIQIVDIDENRSEICRVFFENISVVREKQQSVTKTLYLTVIARETEFTSTWSQGDCQSVDIIELFSYHKDHCNDVRDLKNLIASRMCPSLKQTLSSFNCIGWSIVCTPTDQWRPYLTVWDTNRYVDFYEPSKSDCDGADHLRLDLRKVQRIEEIRDHSYGSSCPYKVYNLSTISIISSVIYHVRSDTKYAHVEHLEAFKQSWIERDLSLSNQFLTKDNVPLAVHKMVQFLQLHGTQIDGLFRQEGNNIKESEKIYEELISDPSSFMLKDCTAYDVANALKLFFRKLDDPLLTTELFNSWMTAVDIKDYRKKLEYFKNIVEQLPTVNYQTLRTIIFLLVEIDINKRVTNTDFLSLSQTFHNYFLVAHNHPLFSNISKDVRSLLVLPFLLENYKFLFNVSAEEIRKEEMIRKGLDQLFKNDITTTVESTLLRQIYITANLLSSLKTEYNFENEKGINESPLFSKQMNITLSMTPELLRMRIFNETNPVSAMLFEYRDIDDVYMHRLIYPQENLFSVITFSETFDCKFSRKWVFKSIDKTDICYPDRQFKCWVFLSLTNKNRVFIEMNESGQLNFWKNEQLLELLANFTIRNIFLYRSFESSKKLIAIKDRKTPSAFSLSHNFPKFIQSLTLKSKSYQYISFLEQIDYDNFVRFYDQFRIQQLTPSQQ